MVQLYVVGLKYLVNLMLLLVIIVCHNFEDKELHLYMIHEYISFISIINCSSILQW